MFVVGLGGCSGCDDPVDLEDGGGLPVDVGGDADGGDADLDTGGGDADLDTDGGDTDLDADLDAGGGDTEEADDTGSAGDGGDGGDVGDTGDIGDTSDASETGDAGSASDVGDTGDGAPVGLSEPCENGEGWTVFRFHYDQYSTSARIDVWDAACEYSLAPGSACNVRTVTQGFGDVATTTNGFPILTTSDYLRVRFSAEGLEFSEAEIHVEGHGFYSVAFTEYRIWSPLYGDRVGGPIDNSLQWSSLDWTGMLYPDDDPGLTAIQIYANLSTHDIAVRSVELCVADPG